MLWAGAVSKEEGLAWGAANIVLYDKHCHRVPGLVEEAYKMVTDGARLQVGLPRLGG